MNPKELELFMKILESDNPLETLCYTNFNKYSTFLKYCIVWRRFNEKETNRNKQQLEIDSYYRNILKKFKKLVHELNLKNSLEISILFSHLLWNGYFSKDMSLTFDNSIENKIGAFPYNIMSGNGVCLNFSSMLKDCLNICDYKSIILINKSLHSEEKNFDNIYSKNKNTIKNKFPIISTFFPVQFLKYYLENASNHAVTLVQDNEKFFLWDSTIGLDLSFANIINNNIAYDYKNKLAYVFNPYLSYIMNIDDECKNLLKKLYSSKDILNAYQYLEFLLTKDKMNNYVLKSNESLLKDYHGDINDSIENISKTILKYNKS